MKAKVMVAAAIALSACTASMNGRPIGLGGSTGPQQASTNDGDAASTNDGNAASTNDGDAASTNDGDPAASRDGATAGGAPSSACRPQQWADPWPYLDRPADPWLAVADGRPARVALPADRTGMIGAPRAVCDAAHDHCLRDCSWLVPELIGAYELARPYHVDAAGAFRAARDDTQTPAAGFVAYRTVPVTRANLRAGALAMAIAAPDRDAGGHDGSYGPLAAAWDVGTVESIDWDRGTLRLAGRRDPYFLSAARVAVLRYTDGGRVEAIAGADARAPSPADVIGPARKLAVADPWAAVGRDGQPVAASDDGELPGFREPCGGRADHCLRPWVWFVDVDHRPVPARWTGDAFVRADDASVPIDRAGVAYRTRPAAAADVAPGARVLLYDGPDPASPIETHDPRNWAFVDVDTVDRGAGTFVDRDTGKREPIDRARVLVLFWIAGDRAAPVE